MKFRSRPETVEAIRWTGENWSEMQTFVQRAVAHQDAAVSGVGRALAVFMLSGEVRASPGDWIVCVDGRRLFSIGPDSFEKMFEPAGPSADERITGIDRDE